MSNDNSEVSVSTGKVQKKKTRARKRRPYETHRIHKTITLKRNGKSKWGSNLRMLLAKCMWRGPAYTEYNAVKGPADGVIASFLLSCPTRSRFPFTSTSCSPRDNCSALQRHAYAHLQGDTQYDVQRSVRGSLYSELGCSNKHTLN